MNYLSAEKVSKSFGMDWLFRELSFGISQGEKVALVGANGAGKSTLLGILAGVVEADEGGVSRRQGLRVGYLRQQPTLDEALSVRDNLFAAPTPTAQVALAYARTLAGQAVSDDELADILRRMDELNAWDFEVRMEQILTRLGLPELDRIVGTLSGGQRRRVDLARVLLSEPDMLLLDEPTNHLDLTAIEWLEDLLATQQTTLVLVTHDRYFLDRVTQQIIELTPRGLHRYQGNYAYFLEKKAERAVQDQVETDKARNLLRKELEWMRRQPKARGTKSQARIDAFYDLKDKATGRGTDDQLQLNVRMSRQGGKILEVKNLQKRFGDLTVVRDFTYTFQRRERVGVVGPNGVGKSTFLNLLTGKAIPDAGTADAGATTVFGYYTQELPELPADRRVIETVQEVAESIRLGDGKEVSASQLLQQFLFAPARQYDLVGKLSGGERRRIQLLRVLIRNPNFLILDEPTNDLDLDTLNVLEDFLQHFAGTLLLVSHDRYFMDRLVDHLFVFEGNGQIRDFAGNYTDFRSAGPLPAAAPAKAAPAAPMAPAAPPLTTASDRRLSFKEKQELAQLEADIAQHEAELARLTDLLSAGHDDHAQLMEWAETLRVRQQQLDACTERWLELSERAEA